MTHRPNLDRGLQEEEIFSVGSNVFINTEGIFFGWDVNAHANSLGWFGPIFTDVVEANIVDANSGFFNELWVNNSINFIGDNPDVRVDANGYFIGNSTVNAVVNASGFYEDGVKLEFTDTNPGGSNTNIQYNDSGAFGGAASFTFDEATNTVSVGNSTVNSTVNATGFFVNSVNVTLISTDEGSPTNIGLAVSASGSALTVALKGANGNDPSATNPVKIPFRNVTETTGTPTWLSVEEASSITVASGGTLGVASSQAFRIWIVGFNDGGTFRLGVFNALVGSGTARFVSKLSEWAVASSTAVGSGSDSAGVFYTGSAVTSKAYKVLGFIEWGTSGITAGTWTTTNLSRVQLFGPGVHLPGSIVQCVYQEHSTEFSTTSTSYVSTGDTVSITLSSPANMVMAEGTGFSGISDVGIPFFARLSRGTTNDTNMFGTPAIILADDPVVGFFITIQCVGWDKPNTTSSQSYAMQIKHDPGTATAYWLRFNNLGILTVMEVMS